MTANTYDQHRPENPLRRLVAAGVVWGVMLILGAVVFLRNPGPMAMMLFGVLAVCVGTPAALASMVRIRRSHRARRRDAVWLVAGAILIVLGLLAAGLGVAGLAGRENARHRPTSEARAAPPGARIDDPGPAGLLA